MIVSIPLYQVKMTIMHLIFSRLLRETYVVLEVLSGDRHRRCKVLVRKQPWFDWAFVDEALESEPEDQTPTGREAYIDKDVGDELRKALMEGKSFHATLIASATGRHPPRIEEKGWNGWAWWSWMNHN